MLNLEDKTFLESLDRKLFKHASNILTKNNNWNDLKANQKVAFPIIVVQYLIYLKGNLAITGFTNENIIARTVLLNNYYDFIENKNYHNVFTSQGKFRPTIIEEFMYILFRDLINSKKKELGKNGDLLEIGTQSYTNLFFSAKNFSSFIEEPKLIVNQKKQDFCIFRKVKIKVNNKVRVLKIPIFSIENKTYIDKTMLDGAIATAEKVKSGNPYAKYFIVTEDYDVSYNNDPVYSKIDQIYILRKKKRGEQWLPISSDVLIDLVNEVKTHLETEWSNIEHKMKTEGKII